MTTSAWAAYYDVQEVESHFHGHRSGSHTIMTEDLDQNQQTRMHPGAPASPPAAAPPSARVHRRGSAPCSSAARQRGTPAYACGRSPVHSRMVTAHSYPSLVPTAAVTIPPAECAVTSWLAGWQRLADEQGCCGASPPTPNDHKQHRTATTMLRTMSSGSLLGSACVWPTRSTAPIVSTSPSSAASHPASGRWEVAAPLLGAAYAFDSFCRSASALPAAPQLSHGPASPLQLHEAPVTGQAGGPAALAPSAAVALPSPFASVAAAAVTRADDWWPEEDDWMDYLPEINDAPSARLSVAKGPSVTSVVHGLELASR